MVQGLSGIFNAIGRAINTQKTALENKVNSGEGDAKSLKALDALETISDAFTSTADLKATESFDDKGVRTLTYTDPTTGLPVKSTTYDPSGKKTGDADYDANGKLVNSATYDPTTGKKLTNSHYKDGVLLQTDTLNGNGDVIEVDKFNPQGQKTSQDLYNQATGEDWQHTDIQYDPTTGKESASQSYKDGVLETKTTCDPQTGRELTMDCYNKDGTLQSEVAYDPKTGGLAKVTNFNSDGTKSSVSYSPTTGIITDQSEYDANGNLTSENFENGTTLTVDPKTGAVSVKTSTGEQTYPSLADYEQALQQATINQHTENAFKFGAGS